MPGIDSLYSSTPCRFASSFSDSKRKEQCSVLIGCILGQEVEKKKGSLVRHVDKISAVFFFSKTDRFLYE